IYEETSLKCSIGIAKNKLVAKIASSLAKPNGIYDVPDGYEAAILAPLPIETIPGIGIKTKEKLNAKGFFIIKDLRELSLDYCLQHFGIYGYHFYKEARGEDSRPVNWEERAPKSLGAETTFEKDIQDEKDLLNALYELVDRAVFRLKQHKMRTRAISIKLRAYNFKTMTRSKILYAETQDLKTIYSQAAALFKEHYVVMSPLRLIGISLEKLNDSWWQPTLF
ncbi:MAG TPA: DNA polymerase IV, partial [Parachlamydiaceae bacterium]|nr:DNA polymerase IV [Parachlamydiaceae bacterium]